MHLHFDDIGQAEKGFFTLVHLRLVHACFDFHEHFCGAEQHQYETFFRWL